MDRIEYNTWVVQQEYWEEKLKNAKLEGEILKFEMVSKLETMSKSEKLH